MGSVWPEDTELVRTEWEKIALDNRPVHFEMRFKRSSYMSEKGQQPKGPEDAPFYWMLASAYPDMAEDGSKYSPLHLKIPKCLLFGYLAQLLTGRYSAPTDCHWGPYRYKSPEMGRK